MTLTIVVVIVALLAVAIALVPIVPRYARWRGTRLVTCPETHRPAAVQVDASLAAMSGLFGLPLVLLEHCSRWPEKRDCGRQCVRQIEQAPDDCLLRTMLSTWYAHKTCARCGEPLHAGGWRGHHPGWLAPDGRPRAWDDVAPERVPDMLATCKPLCWDCLIVERFRREYPDLVVDRHRTAERERV